MELLCVFASMAALFLFCAFLTLRCGLHSALAPLTALSAAVLWLTLWGMAGPLLAGAWILFAAFAALGIWALWPRKGARPDYQKLASPGAVLFWGMTAAFAVYFFLRQPMATGFDELNLWATAVKVTKVDNSLYSNAVLGTPWAVTQNPGLPLLSYFFSFFGALRRLEDLPGLQRPGLCGVCRRAGRDGLFPHGGWRCRWRRFCGACPTSSPPTTTPST